MRRGPLGEAGNTARLHLEAGGTAIARRTRVGGCKLTWSVSLVQIAAVGLAPKIQYQVYLAESDQAPFGRLVPLAVFKTNLDGGGIVQVIGPLKRLAARGSSAPASSRRFLILTELQD